MLSMEVRRNIPLMVNIPLMRNIPLLRNIPLMGIVNPETHSCESGKPAHVGGISLRVEEMLYMRRNLSPIEWELKKVLHRSEVSVR